MSSSCVAKHRFASVLNSDITLAYLYLCGTGSGLSQWTWNSSRSGPTCKSQKLVRRSVLIPLKPGALPLLLNVRATWTSYRVGPSDSSSTISHTGEVAPTNGACVPLPSALIGVADRRRSSTNSCWGLTGARGVWVVRVAVLSMPSSLELF